MALGKWRSCFLGPGLTLRLLVSANPRPLRAQYHKAGFWGDMNSVFCVECSVVCVLSSLEARLRLVQRYRGYRGRPSSGAKRVGLGATKQHMPGWARGLHQDVTPCGQKGAGLQPGSLERRLGTGPGVLCRASCHRGLCPRLPGCFLPPSQSLGSVLAPCKQDVTEPCSSWSRLSCVGRGEQSGGDPSTRQEIRNWVSGKNRE